MRGQRAVGLDRDLEAARVERRDQRVIDLEHRLAPGEHDETMRVRRAPETLDGGDEAGRLGELAPARAVGADEIGVAEAADRGDRKSGVYGKSGAGRVDLGGRRILKKKNQKGTK